jgi:sugar lactone lactonase YvrE
VLEDRLAPAIQPTYGGYGSILGLQDLANAATPQVTISEQTPNQLRIDLGSNTFDGSSTVQATGLSYENAGSPATSHSATVDISLSYQIATLQAALPVSTVTLGPIADAAGGLGNVAISADSIIVTGLDTSQRSPGSGNVNLTAIGALTVAPNATLNTGASTLSLSAGVNADGTGSGTGGSANLSGILTLAAGSTVMSANTGANAITLRGDDLAIDTSSNPALVGANPIVGGPARATITGLGEADALAFDAEGNLYVADSGANTVYVFAPGATTPKSKLTGLSFPDALAFDAEGNLYVADSGANANAVYVFAPGATKPTPAATLTTGVDGPSALAFDAHGNLFVANNDPNGVDNTVSMFAPGSTSPKATLTGVAGPTALAFDASGRLYVADTITSVGAPPVAEFDPGATFPTNDLSGGPAQAYELAVDSSGNIYVTDTVDGTVSVYSPGASSPKTTITGLQYPNALAIDKHGNLFVSDPGTDTVSVFFRPATRPRRLRLPSWKIPPRWPSTPAATSTCSAPMR